MEDDHLISKKEVLEKMGISYGQLYCWKRKGLIPEAWFIRRSTFTGQETFIKDSLDAKLVGTLYAGGVEKVGMDRYLARAYSLGRKLAQ